MTCFILLLVSTYLLNKLSFPKICLAVLFIAFLYMNILCLKRLFMILRNKSNIKYCIWCLYVIVNHYVFVKLAVTRYFFFSLVNELLRGCLTEFLSKEWDILTRWVRLIILRKPWVQYLSKYYKRQCTIKHRHL